MIQYKEGCNTAHISGPCWHAIRTFDRILRWHTHDTDTVVTEINAVTGHKDGSLHYAGAAVDFRDRDIKDKQWFNRFVGGLRNELGPAGFEVHQEDTHIHVEFDPHRTT